MFDNRFGLTAAVHEGRKNMTRRTSRKKYIKDADGNLSWNGEYLPPRYKVGEVAAVAQSYKELLDELGGGRISPLVSKAGYMNKMYVRADLMPTRILITAWRRERLQEISDEDCLREGISFVNGRFYVGYWKTTGQRIWLDGDTPREAFASLIRKMSGKKAWDENPYVDVYEFKLVK